MLYNSIWTALLYCVAWLLERDQALHKPPPRVISMGGYRRTGTTVVVLVVVLACTIADQMAESCGLEGYRDGAITSQPHHFFF